MTNGKSFRMAIALLPLPILAASPADAPQWQVLTLVSPTGSSQSDFGRSVARAGDVDNDGSADVIVGADGEFVGRGRAYVWSGPDGRLLYELVSPNEEQAGRFGYAVAGAGDMNHDGVPDLLVGAPLEDPGTSPEDAGRAYAFSGQDGSLLFEMTSPNEEPTIGRFGQSVAGLGDVDQDGFADVLVGAPSEDEDSGPTSAGRAYVFSGQDGHLIFEFISPHQAVIGSFGGSVAGAGDVNQDGVGDIVVGAPNEHGGAQDSGRAYVLSGRDGSLVHELVSPHAEVDGEYGASVAGAGDVNQDGVADVIVGAFSESPGTSPDYAGRAYVHSGLDGSLLAELSSPNEKGNGFFGRSVASGGDVDQDGVTDLIVGAYGDNRGSGRVYGFSGIDFAVLFDIPSPNPQRNGLFGWSVDGVGDADRDGKPDLIVGAYWEGTGGRAYIFLSGGAFRVNSGGPNYIDTSDTLFLADRTYVPGGFGYVGGLEHTFNQPIGGTDDDPLYQDVRVAREGDGDGIFHYRFDVASPARYDVTLHLMAPALEGTGNVVMDVQAEGDLAFDDLDVTAEAGGEYQALAKTFAVDVEDGTLDMRFRAVNKAAVVSAIAVAAQAAGARRSKRARRTSGSRR